MVFDAKETRFISQRLTGLLYLGKLPKGKSVDDVTMICASVPVAPNGVVGWRCSNLVWDAIKVCDKPHPVVYYLISSI